MRGKILFTLLLAVTIPVAGWAQQAQAHVLERDGDVSAVMHMPPNDEPEAGKQTIINLTFTDNGRGFTVANYDIKLNVRRNGRTVDSVPMQILNHSDTDTTATVVLPEAGAYRLVVQGNPKTAGKSFDLEYDIRANGSSGQTADGSGRSALPADFGFWAIIAGSWAILAIIARTNIRRGRRYGR